MDFLVRREGMQGSHLHDYCKLSCVIHVGSSAWQLPAELRDSCLVTCLIIASWAAWFVTAELHAYCLLIAWFVSAQLFEYCLLRSLFGRHLPGTSPNWFIAFLLRSKCLLISWLQSPSAVILEPHRIKSLTVSIVSHSNCRGVMGLDATILVFWMLSFKLGFHSPLSLSSRGSLVPLHFLP